jgi:hypothetical protein
MHKNSQFEARQLELNVKLQAIQESSGLVFFGVLRWKNDERKKRKKNSTETRTRKERKFQRKNERMKEKVNRKTNINQENR